MALIYKEASFPPDYREAQVRQIMGAVYRLRSIAITGLAGMGKSNVVRFIVSHPQVRPRYLKERANDYAFVHVDCAGLANSDEAEVLGAIVAELHRDGMSADNAPLPQASGPIRHILKEHILGVEPNLNLVLVLDYFTYSTSETHGLKAISLTFLPPEDQWATSTNCRNCWTTDASSGLSAAKTGWTPSSATRRDWGASLMRHNETDCSRALVDIRAF
jgi:hypothetical protein